MFSRDNPSPHGLIRRYIKVTTDFVGFHTYENAPDKVAFLKNNHRHKFHVRATIEVYHDDRELEFFLVLDELERNIIPFVTMKANLGSCEQIAEDILWGLVNTYNQRAYTVVVSEDNENEASVDYDPYT